MAKNNFGRFLTFAAVTGAVAAGISYVLQYHSYHKELEKDFRHFEDEEVPVPSSDVPDRRYVALRSDKDEFLVAAKETAQAAKGMATAAKGILKDVGAILMDNASGIRSAYEDTASGLKAKVAEAADKADPIADLSVAAQAVSDADQKVEEKLEEIVEEEEANASETKIVFEDQATDALNIEIHPDDLKPVKADIDPSKFNQLGNTDVVIDLSSEDKLN